MSSDCTACERLNPFAKQTYDYCSECKTRLVACINEETNIQIDVINLITEYLTVSDIIIQFDEWRFSPCTVPYSTAFHDLSVDKKTKETRLRNFNILCINGKIVS